MSTHGPHPAPAILVAAASFATSLDPWARQAEALDERVFFLSIDEVALFGSGTALDFRFRTVDFGESGEDGAPSKVRDGIVRVSLEGPDLWMDEHYVELAALDGHEPVAHRVRSYYSLAAGEYARAFSLAGGTRDTAIVERWQGLPSLFFFSLGVLATRPMLADGTLVERRPTEGTLRSASYSSPDGRLWTVTYDSAGAGAVRTLESRAPGDAFTDWIFFEGHADNALGLPRRPTLVTQARIDGGGRVRRVSVWQAIERSDPDGEDDRWLDPGARVADMRAASEEVGAVALDRPMRLDRLLTWPGGLLVPLGTETVSWKAGELERLGGSGGWRTGPAVIAGVVLVSFGWLLRRARRSRSA